MGKDKGKNSRSKGANSWEAASNSGGFLGFSAFTSSLSNAIDTEFQIDSEYQVQFKKLQKKDEVSRMKALEELALLFSRIDVQNEQSNKALLSAWELIFKRLVNDDHRKVREMTFICLEILGTKVGKLLAPHVRQLIGPWIVGICDQRDQSQNSALRAFESIFPERKRRDVLLYGQEQAIQYLCENLQENVNTLGDGKATPPEVLQERYERLISNSLLAIEYLMEKIQQQDTLSSDTTTTTTTTASSSSTSEQTLSAIYQPIFESQFFSFLSSKSVAIRRTCYRLISGLVTRLPSYCEANMKDLSTKILGLFSEKDPSAHLYMWNAIISFLKKYKEQAWVGVDVRKHVLPRFWAFLRAGTYGSPDLSYPSILPFLSLIPENIIGSGPEFFKEFFTALYKGLEVLENSKQFADRSTNALLSCYVECIYYSLKKWSNNEDISNYVFGLYQQLVLECFGKEQIAFTESLVLKLLASTLTKLCSISTLEGRITALFDQLTKQCQQQLLVQPTPETITVSTLCSRFSIFFESTSSLAPTIHMTKQLFHFAYINLSVVDNQDNLFEILSILLSKFNVSDLLQSEIKDIKEFINNIILKNIGQQLEMKGDKKNTIFNLLNLYCTIINSHTEEHYQESWNTLVQLLSNQDLVYLVKTIDSLNDRSHLSTPSLDKLIERLSSSSSIMLYQSLYNGRSLFISMLLSKEQKYEPIISNNTINQLIQSITNQIKEFMITLLLNDTESSPQFSMDQIISSCKTIFSSIVLEDNQSKIELLVEIIKTIIQLQHLNNNTKQYSNDLKQSIETISNLPSSSNVTKQIIPILFEQLSSNINPDFEFFKNFTVDIVGQFGIDTYVELLNYYQKESSSCKGHAIKINYLTSGFIPSPSYEVPKMSKTTEHRYIALNLYALDVIDTVMKDNLDNYNKMIESFKNNDILIETILEGLTLVDCDNTLTDTLSTLQRSKQTFKSQLIHSLISNSDNIVERKWWKNILENAVHASENNYHNSIYLTIIGNILSVMAREKQESLISLVLDSCLSSCGYRDDYSPSTYNQVSLVQVVLEYLIDYKPMVVEAMRNTLFKEMDQWSSSMPNNIASIATKLSLISSIIQCDNEKEVKESEGHVLFKVLQIVQQWYLRNKSPMMKDQEVDFSQLDIPLSQFFIVVGQYAVAKNQYLSTNQSQLIQTLLPQSITHSSMILNYNGLKFMNIVLSDNHQALILPNTSEEFLINLTCQLIEKWIDGSQLINCNSTKRLYDLYSIVLTKIKPDVQYRLASHHLSALLDMISSVNQSLQKSSYQLLQHYFTSKKSEIIQAYVLEEDKDTEFIINGTLEQTLLNFDLWKQPQPWSIELKSKIVGHLMSWDLLLKNYNEQELTKRPTISSYLNDGRKVSTLLTHVFKLVDREIDAKDFKYKEIPLDQDDFDIPSICGYLMYVVVRNLPSMARTWWSDYCSSKISAQVDRYIVKYISPLLLKREIELVQQHIEPAGSIFNIKASFTKREVVASYEKEDMNISLVLSIPDTYPLRVLNVDFTKRVGVSDMQWKTWLLSMTSLLLTQDGSVLDVCLLWKTSLDKHFDGVEVCPICYSLFFNGTIPKFQCPTCKHKFHPGCIYRWLNTSHKSTCPLCSGQL